jgi:hypothetical protein
MERGREGERERGKEGERERGREGERERGREGERERGREGESASYAAERNTHTSHRTPPHGNTQHHINHLPPPPLFPLFPFSPPHQLTLGMCIVTVRPALFTFVDMVGARE